MKFPAVLLLSFPLLAGAQGPTAVITPHAASHPELSTSASAEKRTTAIAPPILGYALGSGATQLNAIVATASAPKLGPNLPPPVDATRLYLPPREMYALVESNAGSALSVWMLHKEFISGVQQAPVSIPGVIAHPDLIGFSPTGSAAIVYSQSEGVLQTITHLPLQPAVTRLPLTNLLTPAKLTVSDDGELALAQSADGGLLSSYKGSAWTALPASLTPIAWSLVAKTHDIAFIDHAKTLNLLSNKDGKWADANLIAQGVDANQIASTRDGLQVLAVQQGSKTAWSINLVDGTVAEHDISQSAAGLIPLRDGYTFLLSQTPTVSLFSLTTANTPNAKQSNRTTRGQE